MRYPAPISFTIWNASAERLRIADSPAEDAMACIRHPRQIPSEVSHAALRPRVSAFLVTSAMSEPGVMVSSAATPTNTKKRESSIAFDSTTIIAEDAALSNPLPRHFRVGGRQRLSGCNRQVAPAEGDGPQG